MNGALGIINFMALTLFGVGGVVDHTFNGLRDSENARQYKDPK
ncbi:hypothetical protein IOC57_09010 [Bacillus sp. SD075]|nr:phage holin [Bacillus sp. SD075]MBO0997885.1 hypothetical protein [Bacillus sp. SD075]